MPVEARRLSAALALATIAGAAAADLYRWVDPETGSVKYSSYPPPWYGDPRLERRAPKVEVIPSRATLGGAAVATGDAATSASATSGAATAVPSAATAAESVAALEARRRQALEALRLAAAGPPGAPPSPELAKRMEAYAALLAELDRLDPQGAAARRAETQAVLQALGRAREPAR